MLFRSADEKDAANNILCISQGGLSLGNRDYYLSDDPQSVRVRTLMQEHMRKLFVLAGNSEEAAADKVARSGFTVTKSEFVDAPVVNELPLVLECELVSMNEENCNVVGKIVNCAVDEAALTDGKPDADKMKPICFDTCAHVYRLMGEVVARAFSVGRSLADK